MRNYDQFFEFVSAENRVIHFKLKGFWNSSITEEASKSFISELIASIEKMNGMPFITLVDVSTFVPTPAPVQKMMKEAMAITRDKKVYKTVQILPDALRRMGLSRAANGVQRDDYRIVVASEQEGFDMVEKIKETLPNE